MISAQVRSEVIRLFHAEHLTMNAIATALGIHHETVRRSLDTKRFARPRIDRGSQLDRFAAFIEKTLEEHPHIRATRLQRMLKDRGFEGSVSLIRQRLRAIRPRHHKAYLPVTLLPGEQGQVDWAHFGTLDVEGQPRKLYCFVLVLGWSRAMFARFCLTMEQAIFLKCHSDAFAFLGGVPRTLLYDNLKSVVLERHRNDIRFNDGHLEFAAWYRFRPDACAPRAGWQKGRVERAIRYLRENFYTARRFRNLADANTQLREWLLGTANRRDWPDDRSRQVSELWLEERARLLPLPVSEPPLEDVLTRRSGKIPWIRYDQNDYSIPFEWTGKPVTLRANEERVRIYDQDRLLADHPRSYGKQQRLRDPDHFSRILASRPKAAAMTLQDALVASVPEAEELVALMIEQQLPVATHCRRLLDLLVSYPKDDLRYAVKEACARRMPRSNIIAQILHQLDQTRKTPPRLPLNLPDRAAVRDLKVSPTDLADYDGLSQRGDDDHAT